MAKRSDIRKDEMMIEYNYENVKTSVLRSNLETSEKIKICEALEKAKVNQNAVKRIGDQLFLWLKREETIKVTWVCGVITGALGWPDDN